MQLGHSVRGPRPVTFLVEELIQNEMAREFDAVASVYAQDAVLQMATQPQSVGRQAIL